LLPVVPLGGFPDAALQPDAQQNGSPGAALRPPDAEQVPRAALQPVARPDGSPGAALQPRAE